MTLVKICPKCGYANDPADLFCLGFEEGGSDCSYSIALTPITMVGGSAPVESSPTVIAEQHSQRLCENGHPLAEHDLVCIECGAEPATAEETEQAEQSQPTLFDDRFHIVRRLDAVSGEADLYLCHASETDASDRPELIIKHYRPGIRPSQEVLDKLSAITSPHCLAPLEVGEFESRPYEVYEYLRSGTLLDVPREAWRSLEFARSLVEQLARAMQCLQECQLLHRDLKPANILLRSETPPEFVLADFGASAISDCDVHVTTTRLTTRYAAPETFAGVMSAASDWWSIGIILLELLSVDEPLEGVDDRAFILSIIARPIAIPEEIPDRWKLLLKGLLTRDHTVRWGLDKVLAWLAGDESLTHCFEDYAEPLQAGSAIRLGGKSFQSAERYALAAAHPDNWQEAVRQLSSGELGTWLVEEKLDNHRLILWNLICTDTSLEDDLKLMLALLVLNAQLPLCYRGEVLNRFTFSNTARRSLDWLDSTVPDHLARLQRELWLVELASRRQELKSLVERHRVNLDFNRLEALSLVLDHDALQQQWLTRQSEFPEPRHPALLRLAARHVNSEAELVILLSASLDEFRSAEEIVSEAQTEANTAMLTDLFDLEKAKQQVREGRNAVLRALTVLLADFVRCERPLADEWADTFRFDHRIKLSRAIVLLSFPASQWKKPEGGQHWCRLMDYFRRKVLASVQRGPLMSLKIGANAARIDLTELGEGASAAESLLDAILEGSRLASTVDSRLLSDNTALQRRIRRLRNNADSYLRDTGISSLFLGFPFLVRRDRNAGQTTPRFIPLFLWPVSLEYPDGQGTRLRILVDRDQDRVRLNPALAITLEESIRIKLNSSLLDLQNAGKLTAKQVMEVVQQVFASQSIDVDTDFASLPSEPRLRDTVDCRVISSGVLFQCDFAGQELAEELERLQQLPFVDSPAATLLRLSPAVRDKESCNVPSAEHRFLVTAADPSQEAAVYAARRAPGLMIQGPPGTGKSQTIVNIVADAIAREKTVLVVCQKQAALEVVGHRLQAAGIGNRIAMIGDPSKDRRSFLQSLRRQLENLGPGDRNIAAANHLSKAREVNELEKQVDSVDEAMANLVCNSGLTYEMIISELIRVEKHRRFLSASTIRSVFVELHAGEARAVSEQLEHYGALWLAAKFEDSPLHCLMPFSPDVEIIDELKQGLEVFISHERRRIEEINLGRTAVDIDRLDIASIDRWLADHEAALTSTSDSLLKAMKLWGDLFESGVAPSALSRLEAIATVAESNLQPEYEVRLRNKLATFDDKQIQDLFRDSQTVLRWRRSCFRHIWPTFRMSFKRLQTALALERQIVHEDIDQIVAVLKYETVARTCCRDYESNRTALKLQTQQLNLASDQLLSKVRSLVASLHSARAIIERGESCPDRNTFFATLRLGEPQKFLALLGAFRQGVVLHGLRSASLQSLEHLRNWVEPRQIDELESTIRRGGSSTNWSNSIYSAWDTIFDFQRFRLRFESLNERERLILTEMSRKREELARIPMSEVASWISNTAWRESLLGWKDRAERQWPSLLIERDEFDKKLESLRRATKELNERVLALVPKLPRIGEISPRTQWDDIVMLQGARAKKLRETVGMGKELGLYQLRPVWLASPMTVSRIFPLQQGLFDVVIFDEASQLPVEYSLPAVYRGKTIVVSGDDKQLPPSKFFTAAFCDDDTGQLEDESDNEANDRLNQVEVKDCSDLLELASPVFPKVMLNIHYRSRYRQLIDFSNSAFYDGQLSVPVLHPIERVSDFRPLQFCEVNGVYSDQVNEQEADEVVNTLRSYWSKQEFTRTSTIGVVTFNLKQAELIEDKLETLAKEDGKFRTALQEQRNRTKDGEHCGFFVKNVENVQGDERDYMIFSTTFGRNARGRFNRSFGVLGQSGGERRLNVATTRAKTRMIIFSSMPLNEISDIHKSSAPPQTPRDHLQAYLLYAKAVSDKRYDAAERVLDSFGNTQPVATTAERHSTFIAEVQNFLEQQGWKVERPSSNDAFQFDLAIRREGVFAIAINCDSPRHPDLRFARHREIWRPEVLRSSVKQIHRVWPRAWLTDTENEKRRLIEAVSQVMKG